MPRGGDFRQTTDLWERETFLWSFCSWNCSSGRSSQPCQAWIFPSALPLSEQTPIRMTRVVLVQHLREVWVTTAPERWQYSRKDFWGLNHQKSRCFCRWKEPVSSQAPTSNTQVLWTKRFCTPKFLQAPEQQELEVCKPNSSCSLSQAWLSCYTEMYNEG